jgi:hypothetical protein
MFSPFMIPRNSGRCGFCKIMAGKITLVSAQSETNLDRWNQG